MRPRPAEDREDGIADELLARPVETLDRIGHPAKRGPDACPDLFRIVLGDHPDVVHEVGEQGGHDPPVASLPRALPSALRAVAVPRAGRGGTRCAPHWSQ